MAAIWKFRLLAFLLFAFVGGIAAANLVAETLRPSQLPQISGRAPTSDQISAARLASAIAPFRSDLSGDFGVALAGQALYSRGDAQSQEQQSAQAAIRTALGIGPHDSRLWLVLAMLQAQSNPADPLVAESLKMSYLSGPNQPDLISIRLDAVTANNSLNDSDLGELARGDVRALLTQLSEQRQALLSSYHRASDVGKKFLEESTSTIDPEFVVTLRGTK